MICPIASVVRSLMTNSKNSRHLRLISQNETPAINTSRSSTVTCVLGTIRRMLRIHDAYPSVRMPNGMAMLAPRSRRLGSRVKQMGRAASAMA